MKVQHDTLAVRGVLMRRFGLHLLPDAEHAMSIILTQQMAKKIHFSLFFWREECTTGTLALPVHQPPR